MIKSIVTDVVELQKPCIPVSAKEDVSQIIKDLKDTLASFSHKAIGLSANQIGYNKKITLIRMTKDNEYILINPEIIEKDRPIKIIGESCLSFPGIRIETRRFVFCTIEYLDEKKNIQYKGLQDLESVCCQHELDHLNGITIFQRKWKAR